MLDLWSDEGDIEVEGIMEHSNHPKRCKTSKTTFNKVSRAALSLQKNSIISKNWNKLKHVTNLKRHEIYKISNKFHHISPNLKSSSKIINVGVLELNLWAN